MTREEEAIEEIKRWTPILLNSGQCTEKTSEAQDMAISALSAEGEYIKKTDIFNELGDVNMDILTDEVKEIVNGLQTYTFPDSAENTGEWIPVSERLPVLRGKYKISDDVLITNGFEIDMGYLVERKGKIFWHYYGGDFEVGIKDEDNDATAWMPLPGPYKAEKGGE